MVPANLLDVLTDNDGEISVAANGDIGICRDEDVVAQEILWRFKTVRGDWQLEPECGADLELYIGKQVTPALASELEANVTRALIHDGYLLSELKQVKMVPLSDSEFLCLIAVETGDTEFVLSFPLVLREGQL